MDDMNDREIEGLVRALEEGGDLRQWLDRGGHTMTQAARGLSRGAARREQRAAKRVARRGVQALTSRWSPVVLRQLCRLASEGDKPEVQLKAALAVLEAAGLGDKSGAAEHRKKRLRPLTPEETVESAEVMTLVAETIAARRQKAAMGPLPPSAT
jgi:hypothetical protein